MARQKKEVSAVALVRAVSGKSLEAGPIRSETLAEHAPDPGAAAAATAILRKAGLRMEPLTGIGFSVTGSASAFEALFGVKLREGSRGEQLFVLADGRAVHEIRGAELPEALRAHFDAVAFQEPVELFH